MSAGRYKSNLATLPRDDFPVIAESDLPTRFSLPAETLKQIINKTRFAISGEETRYYLNGLYLHTVMIDGQARLRAVATDGSRLALADMPAPEGAIGMPGVIVPRKTINEARRLLEDAGESVDVQISPQKIRLELSGAALTSKVIDGNFPDYGRVIPKDNQRTVMVDAKVFAQAVDRVATISAEKSRSVRMAIEAGRVVLTVRNMEAGQAVEELEIDYDGDPFELSFNARYLMDITDQISGGTMELRFGGPNDPALVLDPGDADVQYILMPLRV